MITLEVEPDVQVAEHPRRPEYSTCYECHRTFRAKSEDQFCLELCDTCFDALRYLREPVISIHIKARSQNRTAL
jgi:hypothetical protein